MKRFAGLALVISLSVPALGFAVETEMSELKTFKDKLSYSLGVDMGSYLNGIGEELDYEKLQLGLKDGFEGNQALLTPEEMESVQKEFAEKMKAEQEAQLKALQEKNKTDGDAYLAANKAKTGVIVTESGLQYEVLKEGSGAVPTAEDTVTVHYKGTMIDGKVFDDSNARGEAATFGVTQVIPGWSEVLQLMKEGASYRVVIPPSLAYGEQGVPPMIEPNSVLVFEVDLISVEKAEKQ
ncbi:FKBP-type peptidyl-prolyl cis-trans isomerase [Desulfocapsa sulfexigens DSM 10523]|uniref:Peptidyl-prolyl cis-trans isomerase n=1 Tax=Desulfocapsa sulfexigens (strain DSM 10523 / SB164P1) TaxID=1167006 RepID=M1NG49_DESSD|nr:FKBP-type peptidyl-prolyl cis-trans isomerase [Desulfocapsa sulfexigens]AGF78634.1 FKBP-type peptidyl-prolyl cis-trans isomerase [Desulfocapsa sulfexigens DSM 10523]